MATRAASWCSPAKPSRTFHLADAPGKRMYLLGPTSLRRFSSWQSPGKTLGFTPERGSNESSETESAVPRILRRSKRRFVTLLDGLFESKPRAELRADPTVAVLRAPSRRPRHRRCPGNERDRSRRNRGSRDRAAGSVPYARASCRVLQVWIRPKSCRHDSDDFPVGAGRPDWAGLYYVPCKAASWSRERSVSGAARSLPCNVTQEGIRQRLIKISSSAV
jgi:hypothetical protein